VHECTSAVYHAVLSTTPYDVTHGRFPQFDGLVEVVPSPGPPCDALVGFTGHVVLAADVDPNEIPTLAGRCADGAVLAGVARVVVGPYRWGPDDPRCLARDDRRRLGPPPWLHLRDGDTHPRVRDGSRRRLITGAWTADGAGLVMVGQRLCDRWEVGFEVAPQPRGHGLARRLVAAARGLVPAGERLWDAGRARQCRVDTFESRGGIRPDRRRGVVRSHTTAGRADLTSEPRERAEVHRIGSVKQ